MRGYLVARYPSGPPVPARLDLSLRHPVSEDGSPRGFTIDWLDSRGGIVLHLDARPHADAVVLNSFRGGLRGGSWGAEVVVAPYPFSRDPRHDSHLGFELLPDRFRISVDRRSRCDFPYRLRPERVRTVRSSSFLWRLDPDLVPATPEFSPAWDHGWIASAPNPEPAEPLPSVRLFAVLGAWMEEDVIGATVASCFRQGCERVYLVDNDSPDRTVERALAAGATHARSFGGDDFDEHERMRQMQAVVDDVSAAEGDEHVWWLFLDADEFYAGRRGSTVREYLASLDRRFRIVGTRLLNHLPSGEPAYVEGRHPLDYQPLCYAPPIPWYCREGHWKHPLQRWDRDAAHLAVGLSFHTAVCDEPLLEPLEPVLTHHFPYRDEQATSRRLERFFGLRAEGGDRTRSDQLAVVDHMRRRLESLEAIYAGRYADADFERYPRGFAPTIRPWQEWLGPDEAPAGRGG